MTCVTLNGGGSGSNLTIDFYVEGNSFTGAVGTALAAITGPIIIVGVIVLTTSRRFMLPQYANRWWETLALLAIGGIGLSAAYGVVLGMLT